MLNSKQNRVQLLPKPALLAPGGVQRAPELLRDALAEPGACARLAALVVELEARARGAGAEVLLHDDPRERREDIHHERMHAAHELVPQNGVFCDARVVPGVVQCAEEVAVAGAEGAVELISGGSDGQGRTMGGERGRLT